MSQRKLLIQRTIGTALLTSAICLYFIVQTYDISLQKVYTSHNAPSWLISFGDGEVHQANQNFLMSKAINKGFTYIGAYGKKDIDPAYFEKHKAILEQPRGAGYWLWKPYIIKKTLDMMHDGEFLFYIDSGNTLKSNVDFFIDQLNEAKADILLFRNIFKATEYIKSDTYKIMGLDEEQYRHYYQMTASVVILRKSKRSIDFVNKWLEYCENPQLITDAPSTIPNKPDFIDHRHDQAILTLLYYKDPKDILVLEYKNVKHNKFFHHRRRTTNDSLEFFNMRVL